MGWESELKLTPPPGASTVEVTFDEIGDETLVRLVHRNLAAEEARAAHGHGWNHYLERLSLAATSAGPGPDPWATPEGCEGDQGARGHRPLARP